MRLSHIFHRNTTDSFMYVHKNNQIDFNVLIQYSLMIHFLKLSTYQSFAGLKSNSATSGDCNLMIIKSTRYCSFREWLLLTSLILSNWSHFLDTHCLMADYGQSPRKLGVSTRLSLSTPWTSSLENVAHIKISLSTN